MISDHIHSISNFSCFVTQTLPTCLLPCQTTLTGYYKTNLKIQSLSLMALCRTKATGHTLNCSAATKRSWSTFWGRFRVFRQIHKYAIFWDSGSKGILDHFSFMYPSLLYFRQLRTHWAKAFTFGNKHILTYSERYPAWSQPRWKQKHSKGLRTQPGHILTAFLNGRFIVHNN